MGKRQNTQNIKTVQQIQGVEDRRAEETVGEIVFQVYMHCQECANKVSRCLRGFDGVEEIKIDKANNKVIVKGEKLSDPVKILERIRAKYSRKAELISPKPKPKEEKKQEIINKQPEVKKVVILKMFMHCEGCARDIKKYIIRMRGVLTVEADMSKYQVRVKGIFDSAKLAESISKGLGKHVEIMKEELMKKTNNEKDNDKKEENHQVIKLIHYPPSNNINSSCQIFSDENVYSCFIM